jgi:hypothetical protein
MVLENVTLFEVHLDDAQFTADAGGSDRSEGVRAEDVRVDDEAVDDSEAVEGAETGGESSGRGGFLRLAAASVALSLVATVVARRVAGRGDDPVEVDLDAADYGDTETGGVDPSGESVSVGPADREE